MWSEPEPWIVAVLLATGVAVIARHPIARAIGTEVNDPTLTPSVVTTAAPRATTPAAPSIGAVVAPAPTHAPRDPFHALVAAGQALFQSSGSLGTVTTPDGQTLPISPAVPAPGTGTAAPTGTATGTTTAAAAPAQPTATTPSHASSTCAGTVHTVVAGDTLWSIAAKAVKSSDTGRVTVAWHRLYAANQPPLGDNPSLVPVGAKLCVPSSI